MKIDRCYICEGKSFHDTEKMHSQSNILICKDCGAVMHDRNNAAESKLLDFYRKDYREIPTFSNIQTTSNKLNFIKDFLKEFLEEKKKAGKKLSCIDIGAATGYLPKFLRELGHTATGTEYTASFRRVSEHYYGIPLREEPKAGEKYDLISIYHVLEHMAEPDIKLAKYIDILTDDGVIFLATPEFFGMLEDASGVGVRSFEEYYHKNHINLFSRQCLQNLFHKCGLEIIKVDYRTYGQTYLLKRATAKKEIKKECPMDVLKKLEATKKAIELNNQKKYFEATETFPDFPEAWLGLIMDENKKCPEKQEEIFLKLKEKLPDVFNTSRMLTTYGMWLYQYDRFDEAIKMFDAVMQFKPRSDVLMHIGFAFAIKERYPEAINCFQATIKLDPSKIVEATNWTLACCAKMPHYQEKATADIKEQLFKQNEKNFSIEPKENADKKDATKN